MAADSCRRNTTFDRHIMTCSPYVAADGQEYFTTIRILDDGMDALP